MKQTFTVTINGVKHERSSRTRTYRYVVIGWSPETRELEAVQWVSGWHAGQLAQQAVDRTHRCSVIVPVGAEVAMPVPDCGQ